MNANNRSVTQLIILFFCLTATALQAQEYKPFKLNVSLGYAQPNGKGLSAGLLIGLEPKYAISKRIDLGLRLESAIMVRGVTWDGNGNANSGTASGINSAVITATYLFGPFGDSRTRPFLGVGTGIFTMSSSGSVDISQNQTQTHLFMSDYSTIGGLLRAGLKVGHFVASIDYNALPAHVYRLANTNTDYLSKSSYTGIRLGFDIGGGRR